MTSKKNKQAHYPLIRQRYRSVEERCALKIRLCVTENQERDLGAYLYRVHLAKNELRVFIRKRLNQARKTRKWRRARTAYHNAAEHKKKVKQGGKTWTTCEEECKEAAIKIDEVLDQYGVTRKALYEKAKQLSQKYGFHAVVAQTMVDDVWSAVDSNIYRGGHKIYLRSWDDDNTIQAKQYNRCIMLKNDDRTEDIDGVKRVHPYVSFNGMMMPLDIRDRFEMDMLTGALTWMKDADVIEKRDVRRWLQTGEVRNSHRPCYLSIQAERKKNKIVWWAIIVMAGQPCHKKDALGLPRHALGKGQVGDDLGVVSNHCCYRNPDTGVLAINGANTAVFNAEAQERNEKKIKCNQRAMERSRRAMNPSAFDKDGTYIPGKKCRKRSKRYKRLVAENKNLHRKNALMRYNAVHAQANAVRSRGSLLVIENNSPSAWAKKAAPAKNPDGSINKTSNKKRKHLGKSVEQGCPGALQSALVKKFGKANVIVVDKMYRASQYNPVSDEYVKHDLSERSYCLVEDDPGSRVLRDAFASFSLYCSDENGKKPDREKMLALLGEYYSAQQVYIDRMRKSGEHVRNSGISPP